MTLLYALTVVSQQIIFIQQNFYLPLPHATFELSCICYYLAADSYNRVAPRCIHVDIGRESSI